MLFRSGCRQSDCHLVPCKERQRDGWIETRGHGCLRRLPSGVVRYPFQDAGLLRPGRLCPPAGKEQDRQLLQEPLIGRASAGWGAPVFGGTRRKRETHRSTRVLVDWLHARDVGRPLISTGVVFASRGPPRFAPGMYRNSRPNHSPAPCPRASTPAVRVSPRPGILIHGVGSGGDEALAEPSEWRNGLIARTDVGLGIVGQVDQPAEVRKAVMLIG